MQPFGTIKPFLRVAERKAVPHWSFYAAESLRLTSDGIDLNYHHVGLDSSGQIIPNLVAQQDARAVTWQLLSIVSLSQAKKPVESVNSGDIVIILPAMYPGNKDFVDTPRGREAGGYIIASMVNSVVSGNWLRPIGGGTIFLALTCAIGAWLAMTGTPMVVALLLFSGTFLLISAGSLGFSYMGIVSPWLFPTLGFAASGILTFYERARSNELKLNSLKTMLQGRLSEDRIKDVVKNPAILETPPSGRIVSTMFIDIVGFSMLAERQTPEEAFMNLKSLFELLRGIVMKHQGVVDKTLGDGMLCYFGYGPDGRETAREHADLALSCAVEIQKAVLAKNQEAQSQNKPIYPLRIGINTSAVFVGNIGNADHFDFTLIGSGVNLAKRYESACKHYCVMIGSTTYDTLIHRGLPGKPLIKKLIPIKHASNPLEAYECDPFMHQDREIREVTDAYRKFLGIDRKDARWPIPEDLKICVTSRFGAGRLHDFSDAGFGVIMSEYVGNGILFDFAISSQETGDPHPILSSVNFTGEIRWGRPFKKGYLHGVLIKNLSANQRKQLVDELRAILRNDATNKEHTPPEKTSVS